jgi:hypothetical protein
MEESEDQAFESANLTIALHDTRFAKPMAIPGAGRNGQSRTCPDSWRLQFMKWEPSHHNRRENPRRRKNAVEALALPIATHADRELAFGRLARKFGQSSGLAVSESRSWLETFMWFRVRVLRCSTYEALHGLPGGYP